MHNLKQFVGRDVLVSTTDGGAIRGKLWRARRGGLEIRKASEAVRGVDISGILWLPAHAILQVQIVTEGDN